MTTETLTGPAVCGGVTAVSWVGDRTVKEVAGTEPKRTADAPVKPLPVTVTVVPPFTGP